MPSRIDLTRDPVKSRCVAWLDDLHSVGMAVVRGLRIPRVHEAVMLADALPAILLTEVLRDLWAGRVLIDAGVPASSFPHARSILDILVTIRFINHKDTRSRASAYVAGAIVNGEWEAEAIAFPDGAGSERNRLWNVVMGDLAALQDVEAVRKELAQSRQPTGDLVLDEMVGRMRELAKGKLRVPDWGVLVGASSMHDRAMHSDDPEGLVAHYRTMYHRMSRLAHGLDAALGHSVDVDGLQYKLVVGDVDQSRGAAAFDALSALAIQAIAYSANRFLPENDTATNILRSLAHKKKSLLE